MSDTGWVTVDRFDRRLLRPRSRLPAVRPATVVASPRRWRPGPGPELPRADELLTTPAIVAPRRFRSGLPGGTWQAYDPLPGSRRTRVTFDWGEEVAGFLNLTFGEEPAALVYVGAEPPEPRRDRALALVHGLSSGQGWSDTRPRRFRYATVVGTVRVRGAWVDALKPEWARKLTSAPSPEATASPSPAALEQAWRRLQARRQSGQTTRIIGSPTSTTSTSRGSPIRQ